jgi:hypothetical protein
MVDTQKVDQISSDTYFQSDGLDSFEVELFKELYPLSKQRWVPITEIEEGIYLGGIPSPKSDPHGVKDMNPNYSPHSVVFSYNIGLVISFTGNEIWWNFDDDKVYSLHFVMDDDPSVDIKQTFSKVITVIEEARSNHKNIFVHCHAGISRSVTALSAYYLYAGIPGNRYPNVKEVIRFIQSKRGFVIPNHGFLKQLDEFHMHLMSLKGMKLTNTRMDE